MAIGITSLFRARLDIRMSRQLKTKNQNILSSEKTTAWQILNVVWSKLSMINMTKEIMCHFLLDVSIFAPFNSKPMHHPYLVIESVPTGCFNIVGGQYIRKLNCNNLLISLISWILSFMYVAIIGGWNILERTNQG